MEILENVEKIAIIIGVFVAIVTLSYFVSQVNILGDEVDIFQDQVNVLRDDVSAIRESTNATLYIFNESTKPVKQSPYLVDCKIEKLFYTNKISKEELYYDVYIPLDVYISDIHGQYRYYILKINKIHLVSDLQLGDSPKAIDESKTESLFIKPEQVTNELILVKLRELKVDTIKSKPQYKIEIEFEYFDYTANQKNHKRLNVGEISFYYYSPTSQKISIGYRDIFGDFSTGYPIEKLNCRYDCDDVIYKKLNATIKDK